MVLRLVFGLAYLAVLSGCASTHPATFSGSASPDALACALAEATGAGYSVEAAEEGVFFNAELLRRSDSLDRLNVSVSRGTLRVLATTADEDSDGQSSRAPSRSVRRHAAQIVERCSEPS